MQSAAEWLLQPEKLLLIFVGAAVLRMLYEYCFRQKRRLAAFFLGTGSGAAALLLLHFYGDAFGISLPLTMFTLLTALIGGIPGVLLLLLL